MTRTELLDWTLEKNGITEAMELLKAGEQPTLAMQRAIDEMRDEQPVDATYWSTAKMARMYAETQNYKVRRTRHLDVGLI